MGQAAAHLGPTTTTTLQPPLLLTPADISAATKQQLLLQLQRSCLPAARHVSGGRHSRRRRLEAPVRQRHRLQGLHKGRLAGAGLEDAAQRLADLVQLRLQPGRLLSLRARCADR
jgi:hypothetical protein